MPLHDVGYRPWKSEKTSYYTRWLVIASTGIRLALRSNWVSRLLLFCWLPALAVGVGFFVYEQSIYRPELRVPIANVITLAGASVGTATQVMKDPESSRYEVWSSLLLIFFRYPQGLLMLVVVGLVSPRLISYDLRNRGYLLYFSRPIQIWEYILGKSLIICFFLAMMTTVPATILYLVGLSLSPQSDVILNSWDLLPRVFVASLVLMLPVTAVALACSAVTVESRYATFAWFAVWAVGWVSYSVLTVATLGRPARGQFRRGIDVVSKWELVSPFHLLGRVQQWVFGLFPQEHSIVPYLAVLTTVTVVGFWFVHRRLRSRLHS